jgi:hypothetical protein
MNTKSVIVILLSCLSLYFAGSVSAQIATVTDQTCTEYVGQDCAGTRGQGCNGVGFEVPERGMYQLKATMDECGTALMCESCLSVAYIYQGTTLIGCVHNACGGSCIGAAINCLLLEDTPYTLYSCKLDCDGSCGCPGSCTARATVTGPLDK